MKRFVLLIFVLFGIALIFHPISSSAQQSFPSRAQENISVNIFSTNKPSDSLTVQKGMQIVIPVASTDPKLTNPQVADKFNTALSNEQEVSAVIVLTNGHYYPVKLRKLKPLGQHLSLSIEPNPALKNLPGDAIYVSRVMLRVDG